MVLIAVAIAVCAVKSTDAMGMPEHFSVWLDSRGQLDHSLKFMDHVAFSNIMRFLVDALGTAKSDLEPQYILAVTKGSIPPKDLPNHPKLERTLYHVFFLEKNHLHGSYHLPIAVTKEGRGWTKGNPSFYHENARIMEATIKALHREDFEGVADYWEGYLSSLMS